MVSFSRTLKSRARLKLFWWNEKRGVSFSMRMLDADHLRRPRSGIDETLACIEEFRTKRLELAAQYLPKSE
jgi:hypothetical protein